MRTLGILAEEPLDRALPLHAAMHNRAAPVPAVIVSPRDEGEVVEVLRSLAALGLHSGAGVSVRSGGHGYFNGASCAGVMINMALMKECRVDGDTLVVQPGCLLGRVVHRLSLARKAVPHGDCFGVAAGGHFLTAGWDLLLARRHGLGCQSIVGARIALWDGTTLDVREDSHPDLLWAMRGGAAATAGVVTEIRLRLIDEPPFVTWRQTPLDGPALALCVKHEVFQRAARLPVDVSVSFHFHHDEALGAPVCSLNVFSLLPIPATLRCLREHMGDEITALMQDPGGFRETSLLEFRLMPASQELTARPELLSEVTSEDLHRDPARYWQPALVRREMADSHLATVSTWIGPRCESMLEQLYAAFVSAGEHPLRDRMYALVIPGGGRMQDMASRCAMPLGGGLARFEVHWDDPESEAPWCHRFVERVRSILSAAADPAPHRPYRGDIWLAEQASDAALDAVLRRHDRRLPAPDPAAISAV